MDTINGYKLLGELSAQNAGFCRWNFCEKDGHEYFIKEFLSPVYPSDSNELSEKVKERKRMLCEQFYDEKRKFYGVLQNCRTGNNIVILDFFRYGSKYYAVTDKVFAGDVSMSEIAALDESKKRALVCSILYSVAAIHDAGIVHADIKPDNILIVKKQNGYFAAKIIDFDAGFLKDSPPKDLQGDFVYLAPEAYLHMAEEEATLSEKIDIFALGLLIHQFWTGELPYIGNEYNYTFEAALDGSEIRLGETLPKDMAAVISRMLSKQLEDRPSAAEILECVRPQDKCCTHAESSIPVSSGSFRIPNELG